MKHTDKVLWPIIFCGSLVLFSVSLLHFLFWSEPLNRCEMTFMYQWPEFIEIPMEQKENQPNRYRLIVYGEGIYASKLKGVVISSGNNRLSGIPVLFIPGNAGSYRQVRSLGSVSLTKTAGQPKKLPEFNYFAIDTDEELCGLYGQFLYDQTEFVSRAIDRIFDLYNGSKKPPKQLILVGHSMGGLVARSVFTLPGFDSNKVASVITLATPHLQPAIEFDGYVVEFIENVNNWWTIEAQRSLAHVSAVSIGGGARDILVRSELTHWPNLLKMATSQNKERLHLFQHLAPALDFVWSSTDHLCIVWCNQLVRLTTRALFDMVDSSTNQLTANSSLRAKILAYHFGENMGTNTYHSKTSAVGADIRSLKVKDIKVLWTGLTSDAVFHRINIGPSMIGKNAFLLTDQDLPPFAYISNSAQNDWTPCLWHKLLPHNLRFMHFHFDQNWSERDFLLPLRYHSPRRFLLIKTYSQKELHRDTLELGLKENLNPFWYYKRNFSGNLTFFNLSLTEFYNPFRAFSVNLKPWKCDQYEKESMSTVYFEVESYPSLSLYRNFRYPSNWTDSLHIHLGSSLHSKQSAVVLNLIFNPGCNYVLTIQSEPVRAIVMVARQFFYLIPKILVVQLITWLLIVNCTSSAVVLFIEQVFFMVFHCVLIWKIDSPKRIDIETWFVICSIAQLLLYSGITVCKIILNLLGPIFRSFTGLLARIWKFDSIGFPLISVYGWRRAVLKCVIGCAVCYFGCGCIVIAILTLNHALNSARQDRDIDILLLVGYFVTAAFVSPSGVVFVQNLVKYVQYYFLLFTRFYHIYYFFMDGSLGLYPDPSLIPALVLVIFTCLSSQWQHSNKNFLLLPLLLGCLISSNFLPALATLLAASLALFSKPIESNFGEPAKKSV